MLLARVHAGVGAALGRACASGLLLALLALVPLAHASPPDPVWTAGIYDEADFNDVVVAIVSATGLVATPVVLTMPADIAAGVVQSHDIVLAAAALASSFTIRAPPALRVIAAR